MPHNLPVQLTRFIGRQRELAEIPRLLAETRLLTLTGPGGCGKTRLAVHVAHIVRDNFTDGVWLVELAPLRDQALVPQLIAQTLGIPQRREQSALEALLHHVASQELLLVLDNCEHLIADCAHLVQQLLARAPALRILATSREPLALAGETLYPVAGLAVPSPDAASTGDPHDLMHYDAVRLFVERARAVVPQFSITPANATSIVQICRRLDGLPLALELASARTNVLTLQQIAQRLDDCFSLLISRQRSEPDPRHHTLRAALDWSYELLAPPEQVLLRRLAVFAGGCSLTTAETICAGDGIERAQVLELIASLVNKSLVVAQTLQRGEARYSLLETIRQYGQEQLMAAGEWTVIHDRHLHYFLQLAEETMSKLRGPYQQLWLNWLEDEYDNIRAALRWALESSRIEAGLRITNAIYEFWTTRDYVEEGLAWVERLLAQADETISPVVRANALAYASMLAGFRGNVSKLTRYGREAATLAEAAGDAGKQALAWAQAGQSYAAWAAGDYQTAFALAQRNIQLYRELGDWYLVGVNLSTFSFYATSLGDYDAARAMLDEALPLLRALGDPYRIAMALNFSGDLARLEQQYAWAQSAYEESISILRDIGAVRDLASALHNLGYTCLHRGDVERAHTLFSESLATQLSLRNTPGVAECLIGFAAMAVVCGLPAAGARLLAAVALGGERVATAWPATRKEYG